MGVFLAVHSYAEKALKDVPVDDDMLEPFRTFHERVKAFSWLALGAASFLALAIVANALSVRVS